MSVIFQLFCAEDLKQLTSEQVEDLKKMIGQAVNSTNDASLKASLGFRSLFKMSICRRFSLSPYTRRTRPPSRSVNIAPGTSHLFLKRP